MLWLLMVGLRTLYSRRKRGRGLEGLLQDEKMEGLHFDIVNYGLACEVTNSYWRRLSTSNFKLGNLLGKHRFCYY
jgi:hypothetical protein